MNNSTETHRKQTTSYEGCSQERRLEAGSNERVQSVSAALPNVGNGENADSSNLMEKILAAPNLNRAHKRVVKNKGSHGIDGMSVDELDKELEKRNHKFCRYTDDSQIYVKSRKAAERVMKSITVFIEKKLKLKVNTTKSAVGRPWRRKFLGFSFYRMNGEVRIRIHPKSIKKIKNKDKRTHIKKQALDDEISFQETKTDNHGLGQLL